MNNHTCRSALPPTINAGPSDRAGLTDVPVSAIPIRWTTVNPSPIESPTNPTVASWLVADRTTNTNRNVRITSTANAPVQLMPTIELAPNPFAPRPVVVRL